MNDNSELSKTIIKIVESEPGIALIDIVRAVKQPYANVRYKIFDMHRKDQLKIEQKGMRAYIYPSGGAQ